jgi:ABC-2 type transport system ATP-binding protein
VKAAVLPVPALPPEVFLRAEGLVKKFGDFVAVNGVSFDILRGRVFGFLGPNGSGKSTTIRMLAGLLNPSHGSVRGFDGLDVTQADEWKRRLGYMSQKFSLYLDLTVEENLRFFGSVYGLRNAALRDRIALLADRLRFRTLLGALTAGLSTGQRQRVALAAALLHEPELLFLDEPTGGVDPRGRRMFWDLIYEIVADRGMTVLVTTHYMDEAEQCDRLAFILDGRIIADGSPPALKVELATRIFQTEVAGDPFEPLSAIQGHPALEDAYLFGRHLRVVSAEGREDAARDALAAFGAPRLVEPSLEDVFVSLARKQRPQADKVPS